jgi:hypothetical protein
MTYEVVEYKNGQRKVHLSTDDRFEARDEFRWLEDRKEQHDATMGTIKIETK